MDEINISARIDKSGGLTASLSAGVIPPGQPDKPFVLVQVTAKSIKDVFALFASLKKLLPEKTP